MQQRHAPDAIRRAPARDLNPTAAKNNVIRWPGPSPTKVRIDPLNYTSGSGVDESGGSRVVTFLGAGSTANGIAADLLPIFAMATATGGGNPTPPTQTELAKGLVDFNESIFYVKGTPLLRVGQRMPLPIEIDGQTGDWIVNSDSVRAWAKRFDADKRDPALLDQAPVALATPSAADLDQQVTQFLATNKDGLGRGIALMAQLVDNPFAAAPFALALFDKLGDGAFDVVLNTFENTLMWQLLVLQSVVPGRNVLRRMEAILSSPKAGLSADDEKRRQNALRIFPKEDSAQPLSPDYQIEDAKSDANQGLFIFFKRGLALLDSADEVAKIEAIAAAHPEQLKLRGSTSEEEPDNLALARAATVEAILQRARAAQPNAPATAVVDTQEQAKNAKGKSIGVGQLDYRQVRSVEVVLPGTTPSAPDCSGKDTTEKCKGGAHDAKYTQREAAFVAANPIARGWLKDAAANIKAQPDTVKSVFGAGVDLTAVEKGLKDLTAEYDIAAKAHRCANDCDSVCGVADAYRGGEVGATSQIVLCKNAEGGDPKRTASTLIHESSHGTPGLGGKGNAATPNPGTADFAYSYERLFGVLSDVDPTRALHNAPHWELLVLKLAGEDSSKVLSSATPDDTTKLVDAAGKANPVKQKAAGIGLALAQKWITFSWNYVSYAYGTTAGVASSGAKYTASDYRFVADAAATAGFGVHATQTGPGAFTKPDPTDQMMLAAINDRYTAMMSDIVDTITFMPAKSGDPSAYDPSTRTMRLGDAYFALATDQARGEAILQLYLGSRPNISAALQPAYQKLTIAIRDQYAIDNP